MFVGVRAGPGKVTMTCVALLAAVGGTAGAAEPVTSADEANTPEEEMVREISRVRAARGLTKLRQSQPLHSASRRYARWLVRHERFRHAVQVRPPGFSGAGEVLERHYDGGERVRRTVQLWMRSPFHRKVLLNLIYREGGAGLPRRAGQRMGDETRLPMTLRLAHGP